MEIGAYGFNKSELVKIAERIYELNSNKQQLELELSSEEFHQKYIPRRENMVGARIRANFPIVFVMLILYVISIFIWIDCISNRETSGGAGVVLLFSGLYMIYGLRVFCKLMKEETEMVVRFVHSKNPDKAMRFAKKHDINTFQDDRIRTESKIEQLKERIALIDYEISELEEKKTEIIQDKGHKEAEIDESLKEEASESSDEKLENSSFSFTLKEDALKGADIIELNEYYSKEQDYILFGMKDLKFKLAAAEKEISNIDVEMDMVKRRIFLFAIVFFAAAFIQSFIPGFVGGIYGMICFIVGLVAVFAIERACRGPIIRYLVENDSKYVAEYCYKNNVVPIKQKKKEIEMLIKQQEDALDEIKRKKKELDLNLEG